MNELVRTYGKGLTALFVGLVVAWIVGLILVPQIRMIERAFIYEDRGGETAMLALEIDRLYTEKFKLEQRLKASESGSGGSGFPSPSLAPSLTPSPVPSPSLAPSPSLTPSPGGAGAGALSPSERAEAEAKVAELETQISALEAQEDTSSGEAGMKESYSLDNFTTMSAVHVEIFAMTLLYALCVTVLCFLICYPVAYAAATMQSEEKLTLLMVGLVIPYAINELLRIFSWVMILEKQGILNWLFDALGIINMDAGEGFRFVASNGAVFTVMIYAYVLFMVFPIYNTIDTLDRNQIEAARDLGASVWKIHTRVVIPHAKPGIAVGSIMTFMLSAGSIAAPEIVGRGLHPDWFSQLIYRRFFEADSWNQGSAYSVALLVACVAFILVNMAIFKVGIRDIAK
ncbi:ABC transporter permease [Thalassobaculum sp. OXR-137]|uniref:ABC transporter permease n=1 Tax=Thalassobaculum sp. OXR-137 TaxID=3100173 RepID=UPI002AC8A0D7|nr:ABC transporter permease [Thalassobaculum sp. OXR-137]WPZ34540.1 ABC transporter permease [Thalassobaculum sp. OXR-137]